MAGKKTNILKGQGQLEKGPDKYKILIQTIPDIIFELDLEGRFIFVNNAVKQLGYDPEELLGKHFREITYSDDVPVVSRDIVLPKYKGKITGDAGAPKLLDERRTEGRMTKNLAVRILLKNPSPPAMNPAALLIWSVTKKFCLPRSYWRPRPEFLASRLRLPL